MIIMCRRQKANYHIQNQQIPTWKKPVLTPQDKLSRALNQHQITCHYMFWPFFASGPICSGLMRPGNFQLLHCLSISGSRFWNNLPALLFQLIISHFIWETRSQNLSIAGLFQPPDNIWKPLAGAKPSLPIFKNLSQ